MIEKELEKILAEIFDPTVLPDEKFKSELLIPPSFDQIKEVAGLILKESNEEAFQKFFSKNPHFLFRATPSSGDTILGFLTKPPVSSFFNADYAIFTVGQGGCGITLIELENPSDRLFTKKLTPSGKLQTALGQIDDWNQWLVANKDSFINVSIELLKRSKKLPQVSENLSFKTCSNSKLMNLWNAFGGTEGCFITNLVVIGRWSQLSDKERKRLVFNNSQKRSGYVQIRTYDQLIRKGFEGQHMFW